MNGLLEFFSDLILFTGGIVVAILWLIAFFVIGIEIFDLITGNDGKKEETDAERDVR